MEEQSDTPRTEMAEGQRLNPYFEGRFDGESDELCALRLTLARERDEARAIANDRDAMVDHRDRALTAMYQRVDVITRERDEARAEVERLRAELFFVLRGDGLEHLYDGDCPASNALHARDPECPACKRLNELAATEARPAAPDGLPTYDKEKALEWVAQLRDGNKEAKP